MRRSIKKKKRRLSRVIRKSFGFTLIELMVAMIILGILTLLGFIMYSSYLNKARVAIAESTLDVARDNIELYNTDNGRYPNSIDFTTCVDEKGIAVFTQSFCDQFSKDLTPVSYTIDIGGSYTLTARAKDDKKTLLTISKSTIIK